MTARAPGATESNVPGATVPRTSRRHLLMGSLLLGTLALSACSRPRVQTVEPYVGGALPRPDRVLVSYFAISPEDIRLDQGVSSRIRRSLDDQPPDAALMRVAKDTQVALANRLVRQLQSYGLPAELAGAYDGPGTALLVQGQIVAIDQGNRTRRILVGLGAGKSTVSADSQLYYLAAPAAPPRFLIAYEGSADSGRAPGAAETLGAGAAAQRIGTSAVVTGGTHAYAEGRQTTDTAEAKNLAKVLAQRIGAFAVTQGWIPPGLVK